MFSLIYNIIQYVTMYSTKIEDSVDRLCYNVTQRKLRTTEKGSVVVSLNEN